MAAWYDDYLNSDHWKRTRTQRLLEAEINETWNLIRCDRKECGLFVPLLALDVHHITYKNLGREEMEDLAVLCRSCHGVVHGYLPKLWWTRAKQAGRAALFMPAINCDRHLKRIGDVMIQCLAHCDERTGTRLLLANRQLPQREEY